jgi:sterol desaturase/sphingolipid hydroxylase (fatty acid hydroxylase superfamily)
VRRRQLPKGVAVDLRGVLLAFLPIAIIASVMEGVVLGRRRGDYDWRAFWTSIGDVTGRNLLVVALPFALSDPAMGFLEAHRVFVVPLSDGWALVALFFGQEFCYYWYHRTSHRVRWFWATHRVHHSPNALTFAAAYRLGWTGKYTGTLFFFIPLVWLGFPPVAVAATLGANLLYQFWLHADWIPKLGPLELVFNTPSHHRVHHAANVDYLDANYGGVLIVFDRLFGTCVAERDDLPCRYGLVEPVTTYNPIRIEFEEWRAIGRDLWRARDWRELLFYIVGPPGWRPEGRGHTTADLRRAASVPAE